MGQFSNSFPKQFSYLCEYAIRFDLSCSFCEYPFIFHCLHCSPSCFDSDSLLLAYLWLGLSWIDCISANKSFSSPKTSSRKPYTSSKQQERQKHSVETTINFSRYVFFIYGARAVSYWTHAFCLLYKKLGALPQPCKLPLAKHAHNVIPRRGLGDRAFAELRLGNAD